MAYEQKDNSGSMFVNERKTAPNHPDRTGSCTIDGVEYWVSGWIKEGKDGKKPWLSLAFNPKEQRQGGSSPKGTSSRSDPDPFGDDIPF